MRYCCGFDRTTDRDVMAESVEIVQPALFAAVVADEIVACVQEAVADRGQCSIVLAGGRTPGAIYRMLAVPPRVSEVQWDSVRVYWSDERWVPQENMQSNYRMVDETLLSRLPKPGPCICAVNTSLPSATDGARDYAERIRKEEGLSAGQLPSFDLVLLGIGTDGHTASIFPNSDAVDKCGEISCAVEDPLGGWRVTLSPDALFAARRVIFIATGEHKADITRRVLEGEEDPRAVPARLYTRIAERVSFFIGSGAAKKLEKYR